MYDILNSSLNSAVVVPKSMDSRTKTFLAGVSSCFLFNDQQGLPFSSFNSYWREIQKKDWDVWRAQSPSEIANSSGNTTGMMLSRES